MAEEPAEKLAEEIAKDMVGEFGSERVLIVPREGRPPGPKYFIVLCELLAGGEQRI